MEALWAHPQTGRNARRKMTARAILLGFIGLPLLGWLYYIRKSHRRIGCPTKEFFVPCRIASPIPP
jgi:hypothetical protein